MSSRIFARILMKNFLENEKNDFSKLLESVQIKTTIGDLLKIIDLIHSSNYISKERIDSINVIENFNHIQNYEKLYSELSETYNFLNRNIHLIK